MNVVVNGRLLGRRITGVERYGREIIKRLQGKLRVVRPENLSQGLGGHLWEQVALPGYLHSGDILWSPANTGPIRVATHVVTLHDLSPLEHPEWFTPSFAAWYRLLVPLLVHNASRIIAPSDYVQKKLQSRFRLPADRITIIPGGVDREIFHPGAGRPFDLPTRYVLFVGTVQPRKNLSRLLKAWQLLQNTAADTWLLIAGTAGNVFRTLHLPDCERVKFLGYIPDASLPGLYANAQLFILPSLDEGQGLPILEAMACGTPVIAANAGALPETIGEAGLLFDPLDVSAIVNALQRGLNDGVLRDSLRAKGLARVQRFSWADSAEKMWSIFEQCR